MAQNNAAEKATEKNASGFAAFLEKLYADKENKIVKPVVAWSVLGGEMVLAGLIALIVMLAI